MCWQIPLALWWSSLHQSFTGGWIQLAQLVSCLYRPCVAHLSSSYCIILLLLLLLLLGMSAYIMFTWFCTGYRNVKVMSGLTASPSFINSITYLAYNHHPSILAIDTVRAYHLSHNYLVEVDIVLPHTMSVQESHDIAETLQDKIELLENVERAWVHIDYDITHKRSFG